MGEYTGARASAASLLSDIEFDWGIPAVGEELERATILSRFARIRLVNEEVLGAHSSEAKAMQDDFSRSVGFVHDAFDEFESARDTDEAYDWAFIVPARGRHASEVTDFLPILDERYGVTPDQMYRTVAHLAPAKIETYRGTEGFSGVVIYTPAHFGSPSKTTSPRGLRDAAGAARRRAIEAAEFATRRYTVGLAGLGAVLPGVTSYGRAIRVPGLATTTGHAGTVHLLTQIVEQAVMSMAQAPKIGVLGLGAIGAASLAVLQESLVVREQVAEFELFDIDTERVARQLRTDWAVRVSPSRSLRDLIDRSNIIVAAVTDTLDLDDYERRLNRPIDLTGKVLIDDSQPGYFDRGQVEARGGTLAWVVGDDRSNERFLRRMSGYRYGRQTGLHGESSVWGCEAEVGALAALARIDLANRGIVTPGITREIGRVFQEAGIHAAWPPQSFGEPADF